MDFPPPRDGTQQRLDRVIDLLTRIADRLDGERLKTYPDGTTELRGSGPAIRRIARPDPPPKRSRS